MIDDYLSKNKNRSIDYFVNYNKLKLRMPPETQTLVIFHYLFKHYK